MKEQLLGTTLPVLSVSLDPGESVVAETGEFSWMTDAIQMSTGLSEGSSLSLSIYTAKDAAGVIAFASKLPGSILGVGVGPQNEYLVHRHGFLAGTPGIEISAGFQQSFSAGIFAGEGFVLQRVGGQGRAWIGLAGEVVTCNLAPGESLRTHPGHVGMFEGSVQFSITQVPGIANVAFGGDGFHLVALTGPGQVWLQSMPLPVLAHALEPYLARQNAPQAAETGAIGGIIGDIMRGQ